MVITETRLCVKKASRNKETKKKWCVGKLGQKEKRKQFYKEANEIIRV